MSVHLFGDDRVRVWRPSSKLLESTPCSVEFSSFGKSSLEKVISCTSAEVQLKTPKCIVMFTFFSDLTKQCSDNVAPIKAGLWKAIKTPNLELLAKLAAEADVQWKKEKPDLKIVWTLPTLLDFLECNYKFVDLFNQDTLSEREVRGSMTSTTNYRQYIETLKNIFTVQYPQVDILDLNNLLKPTDELNLNHRPNGTLSDMIFSSPETFIVLQTNLMNYLQECTWFQSCYGVLKPLDALVEKTSHEVSQPKATILDESVVHIKKSPKIVEPKDVSHRPFEHVVVIGNSHWIQKTFHSVTQDRITFFPVDDWTNLEDLCELTQKKPAKTLYVFLGDLHIVSEEMTGKSRLLAVPHESCSHCDRGHEFREFKIRGKSAGKSGAVDPEKMVKHHFELFKSELAIFRQTLPWEAEIFCSPVIPYVIAGFASNYDDLKSYHSKLHTDIKYFPTLMLVNEKDKIWTRFVNAFTLAWQELDGDSSYSSSLDTIVTKCFKESKLPITSFFQTSPTLVQSAYKKSRSWLVSMWDFINKSIGYNIEVLLPDEELQDEAPQANMISEEAAETRPSLITVEEKQLKGSNSKKQTQPSPVTVEEVPVKEINRTNVTLSAPMMVEEVQMKEGNGGEDVEMKDNLTEKPKARLFVFSNPVRQLSELCEAVPLALVQTAVAASQVELAPSEERQKHYFKLTVEDYSVTFGAVSSSKARTRAARKILQDLLNNEGPAADPSVANNPAMVRLRADVEEKSLAKLGRGGQQE